MNTPFSWSKSSPILSRPKVHRLVLKIRPLDLSLSNLNPVTISTHICLKSILISSHLYLGRPSDFFPSDFPTKTLYAYFSLFHAYYMPRPSYLPSFDHLNNIW